MNKTAKKKTTNDSAEVQLTQLFCRNGCLRLPNETRQQEGHAKYKKGYEVRLVAYSKTELNKIRRLLRQTGFDLGNPYQKGPRMVQPVYGKEAAAKFGEILLAHEEADIASHIASLKRNQVFVALLDDHKKDQ